MIISAGKSLVDEGVRMEREPGFPYWTAGFLVSGEIEIVVSAQASTLHNRSCVVIPPHTPYELSVRKRQRQIWMIFDPRPHLREVLRPEDRVAETFTADFNGSEVWPTVRTGLDSLLKWWNAPQPQLQLAENAMEKVLLLARWLHDERQPSMADQRINVALALINKRLADDLTMEDLARESGLSPSRFAHLFRQRMGITPMGFIETRRMEQARNLLLTTDLPVQQVGLMTGFPNAQHFSTRFRRFTGQAPSAFRRAPKRRFGELYPEKDAE